MFFFIFSRLSTKYCFPNYFSFKISCFLFLLVSFKCQLKFGFVLLNLMSSLHFKNRTKIKFLTLFVNAFSKFIFGKMKITNTRGAFQSTEVILRKYEWIFFKPFSLNLKRKLYFKKNWNCCSEKHRPDDFIKTNDALNTQKNENGKPKSIYLKIIFVFYCFTFQKQKK